MSDADGLFVNDVVTAVKMHRYPVHGRFAVYTQATKVGPNWKRQINPGKWPLWGNYYHGLVCALPQSSGSESPPHSAPQQTSHKRGENLTNLFSQQHTFFSLNTFVLWIWIQPIITLPPEPDTLNKVYYHITSTFEAERALAFPGIFVQFLSPESVYEWFQYFPHVFLASSSLIHPQGY